MRVCVCVIVIDSWGLNGPHEYRVNEQEVVYPDLVKETDSAQVVKDSFRS